MPPIPHVLPGEVIRASLINQLIDAANAGGTVSPTGIPVPDLFGRSLDQARILLQQPTTNLALGTVLDTFGVVVDPSLPASAVRFVLNQSPGATTLVAVGTPVNVVVAASAGTGPLPPAPTPVITRTETLLAVVTSTFRVGDSLVIVGSGFNPAAGLSVVTFDGRPAASVQPDPANPTGRIVVGVPTGIPGGPVNAGDPAKAGVVLSVTNSGSTPATTLITVQAPLPVGTAPTITNFLPTQERVGNNVTITGTNFSTVAGRNVVRLAATTVTLVSFNATQIVFTVPAALPGLPLPAGSSLDVTLSVTVLDAALTPIGTVVAASLFTARR